MFTVSRMSVPTQIIQLTCKQLKQLMLIQAEACSIDYIEVEEGLTKAQFHKTGRNLKNSSYDSALFPSAWD